MQPRNTLRSALRHAFGGLAFAALAASLQADTLRVPADFPTIQIAVDEAQPGDTVLIWSGSYSEHVFVDGNDITLRAKGKVRLMATQDDALLTVANCDGVRVEGLSFSGEGIHLAGVDNVGIRNVRVDGADVAIIISNFDGVSVRDGKFSDCERVLDVNSGAEIAVANLTAVKIEHGVTLNDVSTASVENCRLRGSSTTDDSFGILVAQTCNDVLVRNNQTQSFATGIEVGGSSNHAVANRVKDAGIGIAVGSNGGFLAQAVGNRVSRCTQVGILVHSRDAIVSRNQISSTGVGIETLSGANTALIHDNSIKSSDQDGIRLAGSGNVLVHNAVRKSGGEDLALDGGSALRLAEQDDDSPKLGGETLRVPFDFDTIQQAVNAASSGDTILIGSGTYTGGVGVSGVTGLTLRGKGKVVWRNPGGTSLAIAESSQVCIQGLRFEDSTDGVRIDESSGITLQKCSFTANVVAVRATDSAGVLVRDCKLTDNDEGLRLMGTNRSVVEDLRITGMHAPEGQALELFDGTGLIVDGNRIAGHEVGIEVDTRQSLVLGNRLTDCATGAQAGSESGMVYANRVTGGATGLETVVASGSDSMLVANRISGTTQRGILSRAGRTVVAGNLVKSSEGRGYQSATLVHLLVTNNVFLGNGGDGIDAQAPTFSTFIGNVSKKSGGVDIRSVTSANNTFIHNTAGTTALDG